MPRHGRMVHAQTSSGPENLARASDLQEYADTIPIHRLQFPQNEPAIVLADADFQHLISYGNKEVYLKSRDGACPKADITPSR